VDGGLFRSLARGTRALPRRQDTHRTEHVCERHVGVTGAHMEADAKGVKLQKELGGPRHERVVKLGEECEGIAETVGLVALGTFISRRALRCTSSPTPRDVSSAGAFEEGMNTHNSCVSHDDGDRFSDDASIRRRRNRRAHSVFECAHMGSKA
jgi:hypothetical protein